MNIPYVMKRCGKCGRWLVASTVNFNRNKNRKYGLENRCKECRKKYNKQWYEANRERKAERDKRYREANKEKEAERHKRYRETNREKLLEYQKQYRENNKDKVAESNKRYRENNKEKIIKYNKQYRQDNKEKIAERDKRYRQSPQGQVVAFNARNKRRHKKEAQGTGVTPDQWLEMMQYFDWRCAYTGERLTDKTRSGDHVVPLDAGGDDMVWNMVPMLRNLNSSKNASNMEEWYKEQSFYDPNRLQKIYKWQEYAYNKYGKDSEYFNTNDIQIKLL